MTNFRLGSKSLVRSTRRYTNYHTGTNYRAGHVENLRHRPSEIYLAVVPPSTGKLIPVMKLLWSEARKRAAAASSSGDPSRPMGTILRKYSVPSGAFFEPSRIMGVSVGPVLITFARMPRLASSSVQVLTNETKAAFAAAYVPKPAIPMSNAADPARMMDAFSASNGSAFCTVKY